MRRRAGYEHDEVSPGKAGRRLAEHRRQFRKWRGMNSRHQQLLRLLVDCVLPVAAEIGMRV